MFSIQTNVNSLVAQQNLSVNSAFQAKTIQQLTSGYRINSSGDDAAGLAVANQYRDSVSELTQGVANGNDGVAQLQIMDGGMSNISQILDRLQTLAMQSASSSFTGNRATLNSEFQTDIAEIDRQAQSIGLNQGGTFAKNLAVYLGAGAGSQNSGNSVVNIDLSKSTVDSNSLGLTTLQAVNSNTYDLGSNSATSVAKIIADADNQAGSGLQAQFTFYGQGYANPGNATGTNNGITVNVSLNGVSDTTSLVNAINSAIATTSSGSATGEAQFALAGLSASVVTDASGNQKLAFSSNSSPFQVAAGNQMANALLGNFNVSGAGTSTVATGQSQDATATSTIASPPTPSAPWDLTGTNSIALDFTAGGTSGGGATVTLQSKYTSLAQMAGDLQGQVNSNANLKNAGIVVSVVNGQIQIDSKDGGTALNIKETDGGSNVLGFSTTTGTNVTSAGSYSSYVASGSHQLGTTNGSATGAQNLDFVAQQSGDSQTLTFTANDASGASHSLDITLGYAAGTGDTLTHAISYINAQLQESGDNTLQQLTAVESNTNGNLGINIISKLSNFSVNVAQNTTNTKGVLVANNPNGADNENAKGTAVQVGGGGTFDIGTIGGAQSAVTAITNAVAALGTAQAAVGKGQNVLNFAINLAQSQITNFSAAESDIRDANVAQEAANLTKAQVLQQASIAAMAQANSAPQAILSLLK